MELASIVTFIGLIGGILLMIPIVVVALIDLVDLDKKALNREFKGYPAPTHLHGIHSRKHDDRKDRAA